MGCLNVTSWRHDMERLSACEGIYRPSMVPRTKGQWYLYGDLMLVFFMIRAFCWQSVDKAVELSCIWDHMTLMWRHCNNSSRELGAQHTSLAKTVASTVTLAPYQYKDGLPRYGYFHYKDETVVRPSYLYNGNHYTGKTTSSYWAVIQRPWRQSKSWSCIHTYMEDFPSRPSK